MNWITEEQVIQAAKEGKIPALRCSLKHHRQGRDAKYPELISVIMDGAFDMTSSFCACCEKYADFGDGCSPCPLYEGVLCCNGVFSKASGDFNALEMDYSNANFEVFQKAESEVCDYIEEVLAKEIAEEEAKENTFIGYSGGYKNAGYSKKPELRHGDYGIEGDGARWVLLHRNHQLEVFGSERGSGVIVKIASWPNIKDKLGNILDDLERNREDLEEFSTGNYQDGSGIKIEILVKRIHLWTSVSEDKDKLDYTILSIEEATEIHQKLGQLLATARRRNEKG